MRRESVGLISNPCCSDGVHFWVMEPSYAYLVAGQFCISTHLYVRCSRYLHTQFYSQTDSYHQYGYRFLGHPYNYIVLGNCRPRYSHHMLRVQTRFPLKVRSSYKTIPTNSPYKFCESSLVLMIMTYMRGYFKSVATNVVISWSPC